MKIKSIELKNFRSYAEQIKIDFRDLNVIIGKNDIGKSTILEALDIFFNDGKGTIKIDKNDVNTTNLQGGDNETVISVEFIELPEEIILDDSVKTTLAKEYLLTKSETLKVTKKYTNGGKVKVFIEAFHPSKEGCNNLLELTNPQLKKLYEDLQLQNANKTKNAELRKAIWQHYSEEDNETNGLILMEQELNIAKEDTKKIMEKLIAIFPLYMLFQADRKNEDGDAEVQDPMKIAVKEILATEEIQKHLNIIAEKVEEALTKVGNDTLAKIQEMDPRLASTLKPSIPSKANLKWADTFKNVSITGDDNIPINKRGSGIRRIILLNFFRADAERRRREANSANIIYAIEEPETSLHTNFQIQIINALKNLSITNKTQVILTTHSPTIVKQLSFEDINLITSDKDRKKSIAVSEDVIPYPSLNEVNYLAFGDVSEEYHNELYGVIDENELKQTFISGKKTMKYIRDNNKEWNITLSDYVRHQIHHPENTRNKKYTQEMLAESISIMRKFLIDKLLV